MWRLKTSLTILAVVTTCLVHSGSAWGGDESQRGKPRPQDQIWLVSTRDLGCVGCRLTEAPRLAVWKLDRAKNVWQNSNVAGFLAADDSEMPTNVFVHGNWIAFDESVEVALSYYRHQAQYAPSERPMRLVIWSWPSTRNRRPLRDVRAKYARTDSEGEYLAWLLSRIQPKVRVSLVGYSFGARVVTGALHNLDSYGSTIVGQPQQPLVREPSRAVLLAAAENDEAISVGAEHELALSQVDQMLVFVNGCDPALKWFRWVDRCARSEALGYRGVSGGLGSNAAKVKQLDTSGIVGRAHYWLPYIDSPELVAEMRSYIWFDDVFVGE